VGIERSRRIADRGVRIGLGRESIQQALEPAGRRGRQRVSGRQAGQRFP
jgi:hypothetical protein